MRLSAFKKTGLIAIFPLSFLCFPGDAPLNSNMSLNSSMSRYSSSPLKTGILLNSGIPLNTSIPPNSGIPLNTGIPPNSSISHDSNTPLRSNTLLRSNMLALPSPEIFTRPKVLIFSKTNGFRHASIPAGIAAIKKLGEANGFDVDATEDSTWFRKKILKKYAALIFLSPTGTVFGPEEQSALQDYIHHGGGFVGIHAATDCEYNWQWYGDLVGGYFKSHPKQQQAKLIVVDKDNPATRDLPDPWERFDEWYNFKYLNPDITVLLKIDEKSYTGGENGDNHPMAWYHAYDGGRAFYTELGHTDESYSDPKFLGHLLGGIKYAIARK